MSGGHFDYDQNRISNIVSSIEELIEANDTAEYPFTSQTIEKFREAVHLLKIAYTYAQRIDWLVSADDDEESFHVRLEKELAKISLDKQV